MYPLLHVLPNAVVDRLGLLICSSGHLAALVRHLQVLLRPVAPCSRGEDVSVCTQAAELVLLTQPLDRVHDLMKVLLAVLTPVLAGAEVAHLPSIVGVDDVDALFRRAHEVSLLAIADDLPDVGLADDIRELAFEGESQGFPCQEQYGYQPTRRY